MDLVRHTLKTHRSDHDLSCLALAKAIGISSGQLAALESGRDTPSLWTLKKLAKFFAWGPKELGAYVLECKPDPAGPKRLRKVSR